MSAQSCIGLTFLRDVLSSLRESTSSGDPNATAARTLLIRFGINTDPRLDVDKISLFRFCASVAAACMNDFNLRVIYPDGLPQREVTAIINVLNNEYRTMGDITLESVIGEISDGAAFSPNEPEIRMARAGTSGYQPDGLADMTPVRVGPCNYEVYFPTQQRNAMTVVGGRIFEVRWDNIPERIVRDAEGALSGVTYQRGELTFNNLRLAPNIWIPVAGDDAGLARFTCQVPAPPDVGGVLRAGVWIRFEMRNGFFNNRNLSSISSYGQMDVLNLLQYARRNIVVNTFFESILGADFGTGLNRIQNLAPEYLHMWSQIIWTVLGIARSMNM